MSAKHPNYNELLREATMHCANILREKSKLKDYIMTNQQTSYDKSDSSMWRTHESVLRANYPVREAVETGDCWHARKFILAESEVMEKRFIAKCYTTHAHLQSQYNVLGSFHETSAFTITREQFEFLKELWK